MGRFTSNKISIYFAVAMSLVVIGINLAGLVPEECNLMFTYLFRAMVGVLVSVPWFLGLHWLDCLHHESSYWRP